MLHLDRLCRASIRWLLAGLLSLALFPLGAQAEPAGAKDHALLSRMPGFEILEWEQKPFDALELKDFEVQGQQAKGEPLRFEGRITMIKYIDPTQSRSNLQIFQNYEAALQKLGARQTNAGFKKTSDDVRMGYHVFKLPAKAGAEPTRVLLYINSPQWYSLTFIEPAAMAQEVSAGQLAQELKTAGVATLYIEFDTNKSELKPDAHAAVRAIAELMRQDPKLKLSIEGHTDNVGQPGDNKKLSLARADAVTRAVVAQGIAAARLRAVGHGQEMPVADNRKEEGRAKNRRVELVPMR